LELLEDLKNFIIPGRTMLNTVLVSQILKRLTFRWSPYLLVALLILSINNAQSAGYRPALFGSQETPSTKISLFPKWQGTLERYFKEKDLPDQPCESSIFSRCHLQEWSEFLDEIRNKSRLQQIHAVNTEMNRTRYIVDPRNYGVPDYWATPKQFLRRDGDCEDYAISKYLSLRALGVPASNLRILVLQDLNLRLAHAVLIVYHKGRALLLDNQIKHVVDTRKVHHYKPIYSINEQFWWLHRS